MGGGGKAAAAPATEAPKPYQQEKETQSSVQTARDRQLQQAKAALGQEGSILTSPFGTQQAAEQRKSLLG